MDRDNMQLIVKMKEAGEFTQIIGSSLRTYYTCVRYDGSETWSCIKGWFESYDNSFKGNRFDSKVLSYCKFRDTIEALKKDIQD